MEAESLEPLSQTEKPVPLLPQWRQRFCRTRPFNGDKSSQPSVVTEMPEPQPLSGGNFLEPPLPYGALFLLFTRQQSNYPLQTPQFLRLAVKGTGTCKLVVGDVSLMSALSSLS